MDWKLIATAPTRQAAKTFHRPRLALWCPKRGFRIGYYDDDEHNKTPRPFWRTEAEQRRAIDRADQPTHWDYVPDGPPPPEDEARG